MASLPIWSFFPPPFMNGMDLRDHPNLLTVQLKRRKPLRLLRFILQVQHQEAIIYKWKCVLVYFKERSGGMATELRRKKREVMLKELMNKQDDVEHLFTCLYKAGKMGQL